MRRLKDGESTAKMMDSELDVLIGQRGESVYSLDVSEDKEVCRGIRVVDRIQSVVARLRLPKHQVCFAEHESRHIREVLVAQLLGQLDRFVSDCDGPRRTV